MPHVSVKVAAPSHIIAVRRGEMVKVNRVDFPLRGVSVYLKKGIRHQVLRVHVHHGFLKPNNEISGAAGEHAPVRVMRIWMVEPRQSVKILSVDRSSITQREFLKLLLVRQHLKPGRLPRLWRCLCTGKGKEE